MAYISTVDQQLDGPHQVVTGNTDQQLLAQCLSLSRWLGDPGAVLVLGSDEGLTYVSLYAGLETFLLTVLLPEDV